MDGGGRTEGSRIRFGGVLGGGKGRPERWDLTKGVRREGEQSLGGFGGARGGETRLMVTRDGDGIEAVRGALQTVVSDEEVDGLSGGLPGGRAQAVPGPGLQVDAARQAATYLVSPEMMGAVRTELA